jgi:hypothetical protein
MLEKPHEKDHPSRHNRPALRLHGRGIRFRHHRPSSDTVAAKTQVMQFADKGSDDGAGHDAGDDKGGDRNRGSDDNSDDDNDDNDGSGSGRSKPRVPGGSGCDDAGDVAEHASCGG